MRKKIIIVTLSVLIVIISLFICYGRNNKKINIYNVVRETFLTDKGYSNKLSKYVSEDVFKGTNIYIVYGLNSPEYNRPLKIDFNLKEKSQNKKDNLVFVKMIYSVKITDSQNKTIGGK